MVAMPGVDPQNATVMSTVGPLDDLVAHLARSTALGRGEIVRIVAEVISYFDETLEQFVRRRHGELQAESLSNPIIYARIQSELRFWRVAVAPISERQIRRIVYG